MALVLFGVVSITSSSCVGLMDLNDYESATDELCDLLDSCFGASFFPGCHAYAEPRLTTAEADEREAWLVAFADRKCLENCTNARICLDNSPVCTDLGEGCGEREACCGFITGKGDCSESSRCCRPDGTSCTTTADCCESECTDELCGGYQCLDAGVACEEDFECCTKRCLDTGVCADQICFPEEAQCSANIECCTGYCDLATDKCSVTPCIPLGESCNNGSECCSALCFRADPGDPSGVCSLAECLPEGTSCDPGATEDLCCDGFCDVQFLQCRSTCLDVGDACADNSECCNGSCDPNINQCACVVDGLPCSEHAECCGQTCTAQGTCGFVCPTKDDPCSHDVCSTGVALSNSCTCDTCAGNANLPDAVNTCIPTICAAFPDCCCGAWSDVCVTAVDTLCGAYCPPLN
jgi:hypothetical protein